jgi:riboflavin-specific deaminase-like protein
MVKMKIQSRYYHSITIYFKITFFLVVLLSHQQASSFFTTINTSIQRLSLSLPLCKCELRATNFNENTDANEEASQSINLHHAESTLDISGVTLKMAFDTTFSVADASEHKSERFTCPQSLDMVHKLRRWSDCVLVGRGTVERDDCTLTVRRVSLLPSRNSQPTRVVIDPSLKILQKEYSMFKDGHRVIIYHTSNRSNQDVDDNGIDGNLKDVELVRIPKGSSSGTSDTSTICVSSILQDLYSKNINHVMVEGGPATAIQFLNEKLVDRAILVKAPVTFIEPVPSDMTNEMLIEAGLEFLKLEQCGDDVIEYWSKNGAPWPSVDHETNNETWPY